MLFNPKFRRAIAALMALWLFGLYSVSVLAFARPAWAAGGDGAPSSIASGVTEVASSACVGANTAYTPDVCAGLNTSANQVDDKLVKPAMQVALLSALLNLVTFVFDRLAYESAVWVATGGEGETPLFNAKDAESAWKDFGLDIAGDAIGELNESVMSTLNLDFDICAPTNPLFKLSLQLGIKQAYQPQEPKCDFKEIRDNWDSFITTTVQTATDPSQTVLKAFAEGFKPGQNELSATVGLNLSLHQKVLEAKTNKLFEQVNSGGFKSVTDVITGKVKTPSSLLQDQFQRQIANSNEKPTELQVQAAIQNADLLGNMFLHVAGVFTNTLLSTLMNRIYTGFFDVQPDVNLLDGELAGVSSVDDAAARFASLITAAPTQVSNYDVLAEFVSCPVGPVTVRNINQCVLDSGFASAIARAESGSPMTVQDAIDEGLIHGDWPLIPHEGDGIAKNQDSLCYTYGYCVGNLVKLRKARILPIGWEIAASRNDSSNPSTLQEILDGYGDCGDQNGGIDSGTHKWCHLIDPNWVLKYPETQCRAIVNGELLISTLSAGRAGACVDTPSCIAESNDGSCDGGFGYCVEEKNVWRFRGEDCSSQYASCMAFENTDSGDSNALLLNTVDYANCDSDNAGCEWYRTNKYYDDAGTTDDTSDDTYEWLAGADTFVTADREDDVRLYDDVITGDPVAKTTYSYATTGLATETYDTYAYQDRVYYNNDVEECSSDAAGCTAVYPVNDSLVLNLIQNPSFETDDNDDGEPDGWTAAGGTLDTTGGAAYFGTNAYATGSVSTANQSDIPLAPGSFYTLSFYARQDSSGDSVTARVVLTDDDGAYLDLAGTSTSSGCAAATWDSTANASVLMDAVTPTDTDYERYDCTFTVPDSGNGAVAQVWFYTEDVWIDSVQLELGETASTYTEGYNTATPSTSYLLMPPAYLGCSGSADDAAECENYAQVCTAQDVGCSLYTPDDGDPSIPAIAQEIDECPSECVGYAAFKQEATDREEEDFPLYFIAERATSCSSDYVGCDAFTNLDSSAEGGESDEYYTDLRACLTSDMAGTDDDNTSSAFFTWEGSDLAGFQLVTWTLLESDADASDTVSYTEASGVDDSHANLAPCTHWEVSSESTLVCVDDVSGDADLEADDTCNEHDDILENPDCREFYDASGYIHYRDLTQTVTVSDDCHPYRFAGGEEADCTASGGYWTDVGDCRYFGLPEESTECPAAQAGCRSYTGGAGRNASTVYSDDVEDGSVSEYYENTGASVSVSNESVATDGHSARVLLTTGSSITTSMQFLSWTDKTLTYDSTDPVTTCSGIDAYHTVTSSGCEIDYGSGNACIVDEGDNNCGTLDDSIVQGKTYLLSFWAKGSGDVYIGFDEAGGSTGVWHDLVDPNDGDSVADALTLEGGWHEYTLGPLDTSSFSGFDDTANITFGGAAGLTFYLDNIRLKAVEENVTIIKDSWVVPSTCDQTADGADSPQYYLGCEEYTDQNGDTADLYQFSDLCSEEVVGCEAVYDTQNSDDAFGMVYNARCTYVSNNASDDDTVVENTACVIDDATACTISSGESYCLFDYEGSAPVAKAPTQETTDADGDGSVGDGYFKLELGPEARAVSQDMPAYVVDDGSATCTSENAGCTELGFPTYDQDKSNVESFESVYFIDDPDTYSDILCENQALFCEEWSSTQDGNYYFKDPGEQTCEYQSGVTIDGTSYSGWFKSGTDDPCDSAYVVGGNAYGIWRNGDDEFTGWGGSCPDSSDLCTEFRDESDTDQGTYPAGTPYYFLDDSGLSEESLTASEQCQGQVSQKAGCGLFNDTSASNLSYATTPSYMASTHADDLFGDEPGSKQDPISCSDVDGAAIVTPDGDTVNLCTSRCAYVLDASDSFTRPSAEEASDGVTWYDNSCYDDADCPELDTDDGETVEGSCTTGLTSYPLGDDANRVIKVTRDRECAAWLSCQSSQVSWNARTSKYETICDRVGLCTRYTRTGDTSFCTEWSDTDPVVLDASEYAARDITWNGVEYAGYAIPNQLPVDHYDQVDVSPETGTSICVDSNLNPEIDADGVFVDCDDETDCTDATYSSCHSFEQDFRLAYNAGPCSMADDGWGGLYPTEGSCVVGQCENSGDSCANDDDCDTTTAENCVVGYCQYIDPNVESCSSDSECTSSTYPTCDMQITKCVNELAPNASTCVDATDCASTSYASGSGQCSPDAISKTGACFNNQCLTDLEGNPLTVDNAEVTDCRGYPETISPFPTEVVSSWKDPNDTYGTGTPTSPSDLDSQPYSFVYGYETSNSCAPVPDENDIDLDGDTTEAIATDDCVCSYDKAQYGTGGATVRYYPPGTALENISADGASAEDGICLGGQAAGTFCTLDSDCSGGTCAKLLRNDTVYGWEGYCLERDTSIQKNGNSSEDSRACLTWLPVDQLSGSTDLYGKYLSAGYPATDTFFCGEIQDTYTLYVGNNDDDSGAACAETGPDLCVDGDPDGDGNAWNDFTDSSNLDDSCLESVWCPDGYFAVMTGCGALAKTNGTDVECSGGDDDCPFFCVPKGSYKTAANTDIPISSAVGDPCLPPVQLDGLELLPSGFTLTSGSVFDDGVANPDELYDLLQLDDDGRRQTPESSGIHTYSYDAAENGYGYPAFDVYLVHDQMTSDGDLYTFNDLFEYYDDCTTRGIVGDNINDFIYPFETAGALDAALPDQGSGWDGAYYDLQLQADSYAACTAVVQVSQSSPDGGGNYNYAWTDRDWASGDGYAIQDSDARFQYETDTVQSIFGRATDVDSFMSAIREVTPDLYPMLAVMCSDGTIGGQDVVSGAAACDSGSLTDETGIDAQPYYDVEIGGEVGYVPVSGTSNEVYCDDTDGDTSTSSTTDPECRCSSPGEASEDCNAGITCTDTDGDGDFECDGGPYDTVECERSSQCYAFVCAEDAAQSRAGDGSQDNPYVYADVDVCATIDSSGSGITAGLVENEETADAINRLRQIFVQAMNIWFYRDGFTAADGTVYSGTDRAARTASDGGLLNELENDWIIGETEQGYVNYNDETSFFGTEQTDYGVWDWDYRYEGDPDTVDSQEIPTGPVVLAVGECDGTECEEGEEGTFSVNGNSSGSLSGSDGYKHVAVAFFTYADEEQMPIRNIRVDWGDGTPTSSGPAWPLTSQSGSFTESNYYQNHRGFDEHGNSMCDDNEDGWGGSSDACSTSYVTYQKDYTCSQSDYNSLLDAGRECQYAEDGSSRLLNSPCYGGGADGIGEAGTCVFQPRVYVEDNWGWCTGTCDGGDEDGTDACYGMECGNHGTECPSVDQNGVSTVYSDTCAEGTGEVDNPWVNYDGYIEVSP